MSDRGASRWDGARWRSLGAVPAGFQCVWGSGPGEVYFGGDPGAIWRWDGAGLGRMSTGISLSIFAIWGSGPHVYAAGDDGIILRRGP